MKNICITIPYPPSVNKTYYNRHIIKDGVTKNLLRGRGLTKEAKTYKKYVASLIYYSFREINFGKDYVKVTILDNPSHRLGDNHNCEKIVFDAIEMSKIIQNDKQIIAHEIIPGICKNPPSWTIKIEPYTKSLEENEL